MPRSRSTFIDSILDRVSDAAEDLIDDLLQDLKRELPRLQAQAGIQSQGPPPRPRRPGKKARSRPQEPPSTPNPIRMAGAFYEDLEVSPRASQATIKAAYRSLAERFHPDKGKDPTGEKMRQLNVAYGILSDPEKRKKYDKSIGL